MAKVTNRELNECITQAISEVIREDWEDDIVNAAMNDKRAQKAFEKDKKKEDDAEEADDKKIETADANDAPDAEDDDSEDSVSTGNAYSDVRGLSYEELKNILAASKRGTAVFRAATRELMDRDKILADKDDILNGEIIMPYGWKFDENGYPVRVHEFKPRDIGSDTVDISNSNGTNFHWLKTPMSARGGKNPKYADEPEVGMQNADWV